MTRIRIPPVLAALIIAALPARADPTLRPAVTVATAVLRLGDLFADAGAHAGETVAAAPAPGMRITYNSDWLASIAREHNLDWTPSSVYDQTTVVRASQTIGPDAIAQQMMASIAERQPVKDADLELDNPALRLVIPAGASDSLAVDGLVIEQRSGRISAVVSAPAGDPAAVRQRVTGRLVYHVELPVLNRPMSPGAVIAAGDLATISVRRDRAGPDVATDPAQLIGKTPRRPEGVGDPVRLADIERPILVHKGDLVTVVLATPSLQLTSQGKALEDGAQGAIVRVENTKSSRIIDATVTGPDAAEVSAPSVALAAAARTAER